MNKTTITRLCNGCLEGKKIVNNEYGYCEYCSNHRIPKQVKDILNEIDIIGRFLENNSMKKGESC